MYINAPEGNLLCPKRGVQCAKYYGFKVEPCEVCDGCVPFIFDTVFPWCRVQRAVTPPRTPTPFSLHSVSLPARPRPADISTQSMTPPPPLRLVTPPSRLLSAARELRLHTAARIWLADGMREGHAGAEGSAAGRARGALPPPPKRLRT